MPRDVLDRHSDARSVEGKAFCIDCPWTDRADGFRLRAGRHHHQTGHMVVTEATTTYERVAADPNQTNIFDFLGEAA